MKNAHRYNYQTNTKLPEDIFRELEELSAKGVDIAELKRIAITEAVKKVKARLDKAG